VILILLRIWMMLFCAVLFIFNVNYIKVLMTAFKYVMYYI